MPIAKAKNRDVVVRFAGRRVRITTEPADVSADALERAIEQYPDEIEVLDEKPEPEPYHEPEPEVSKPSKGKRSRKSDYDDEVSAE